MDKIPDIKLNKISENIYEIPKEGKMNVPARLFSNEKLLQFIKKDKTLTQLRNIATLPGVVKNALAMPDAHQGYGFPIGGVLATNYKEEGIISPGGIGFDINCGVRLLRTNLKKDDIKDKKKIVDEMFKNIPSGVGSKAKLRFTNEELTEAMEKGIDWSIEQGFATKQDKESMEEYGRIKHANPEYVSEKAYKRGRPQLGSLGAGNHFVEIQYVENIFEENTARKFNLERDQIVVMIHTGSRGLGHQVATDYLREMEKAIDVSKLPDRELVYVPFNSELGQRYFQAMSAAANYAWNNRQLITHWVRNSFSKILDMDIENIGLETVYDVAHNIGKIEKHKFDGETMKLIIQRKGATRSLGPGSRELPRKYYEVGQPVIIPGSMGTASYVLVGTKKAEEVTFSSTAHGAGRVMSRFAAVKKFKSETITQELKDYGVYIKAASWKGIVEEAPQVYKNIDDVVNVSHNVGIGNLVARLKPIGVIKG